MSLPDKSHRQLLEEAKVWLDVAWGSGISARDDMNLPTPNADRIFGLSQRIAAALTVPSTERAPKGETPEGYILVPLDVYEEMQERLSAIEPLYEAELTLLIDYHDNQDTMADAMGFNESSLYHAKRSAAYSAMRDAIKKREADTLAKMVSTDGGTAK